MLQPDDRQPLHEALRPPEGFALDYAIGTTFSLDLLALMHAPLAFTQFDWEEVDQGETLHSSLLLKTLRDYADRMTVFCQAGHIHVPPAHRLLFTFLEGMVVQVNPPAGVFHPKVWALRYTPMDEKAGDTVKYRLLVSSRNLTFDRCWDTLLVLEGNLLSRTNAIAMNHPLGNFFKALPAMSLQPVSNEVSRRIIQFEHELRRTHFEGLDKTSKIEFMPLGVGGSELVFDDYDKLLVVSPFLSEGMLRRLRRSCTGELQLISRVESLETLPADALNFFKKVWVLNPDAQLEPADADDEMPNQLPASVSPNNMLSGLHAKLFIGEFGSKVEVFTGSANATESGFHRNVEFMVKLEGRVQTWGIETFLGRGSNDEFAFGHLLQEYRPSESLSDTTQDADGRLNQARQMLLQADLTARVNKIPDTSVYSLALSWQRVNGWSADIIALCWPISLSSQVARVFNPSVGGEMHFEHLADASLTAFFAFELRTANDQPICFVLQVPLQNAPQDRRERVLANMLNDPDAFARFLKLLLGDESNALSALTLTQSNGSDSSVSLSWSGGGTLLEALLRALQKQPCQLDEVNQIVNDLRKVPGGEHALPAGFDQIWEPIWDARKRIKTP